MKIEGGLTTNAMDGDKYELTFKICHERSCFKMRLNTKDKNKNIKHNNHHSKEVSISIDITLSGTSYRLWYLTYLLKYAAEANPN